MEITFKIKNEVANQVLTKRDKGYFLKKYSLENYLEGHKGFIAGGCFKDIFLNQPLKDIDIFFRSEKDFIEAIMYYSLQDKYEHVYENENAVSYINKETDIRIELIKRIYGSPEYVLSQFDFSIAKFAVVQNDDPLFGEILPSYYNLYAPTFFEDLTQRKINIDHGIVNPLQTFDRMLRYTCYGFRIDQDSKQKLLENICRMPEINIDDLNDENYF